MLFYYKISRIYIYLSRIFFVAICALLHWKVDSANFFTFRMYAKSSFDLESPIPKSKRQNISDKMLTFGENQKWLWGPIIQNKAYIFLNEGGRHLGKIPK